jgi:hypothetical protein
MMDKFRPAVMGHTIFDTPPYNPTIEDKNNRCFESKGIKTESML